MSVQWISFDVDYLGGAFRSSEPFFCCGSSACVRNMPCSEPKSNRRPKTQVLSMEETEKRTKDVIQLIKEAKVRKAVMCKSHAAIVDFIHSGDAVYNIDAHHDEYHSAKTKGEVHCGNWVSWAKCHNIDVFNNDTPIDDIRGLIADNLDPVHLFIATSPNYASEKTDAHLMRILYTLNCPITTNFTK